MQKMQELGIALQQASKWMRQWFEVTLIWLDVSQMVRNNTLIDWYH